MSCTVVWSENDRLEYAGRLELTADAVCLAGSASTRAGESREVGFADLADIYLERCAPAKHPWEPSLVLVTREGDRFAIGSPEGVGALHELAGEVISAYRKRRVA